MTEAPISIDFARGQVELLDLDSAMLEEPFFRDTVARMLRERPDRPPRTIDLARFVLRAGAYPTAPDGLVFHAGRCGSTLLTNMLVRGGGYVAVREPDALNALAAAWLAAQGERRRQVELISSATMRILAGAIDGPRRRILKFAAWNTQMSGAVLRLFDTAAAAFVYRSPEATVASQLQRPPEWFDIIDAPRAEQARYIPSITEISGERRVSPAMLLAHAWRSSVEAARAAPDGRLVFVGYEALTREPAATVLRLLNLWGHPHTDDMIAGMVSALSIYAKDPDGRARFDPLGAHRRPPLSPLQRREVEMVAGDTWRTLQRYC